jgi:hypothetical protein
MDQGPLVTEETDAGAELVQKLNQYFPVKAAFWLKASDEDERYLYIASDKINETNVRAAYREAFRLANEMQSPYLNPFRLKLIGGQDQLTVAALDVQNRFAGLMATRFHGKAFGGQTVDDVYLYPPSSPAAVP